MQWHHIWNWQVYRRRSEIHLAFLIFKTTQFYKKTTGLYICEAVYKIAKFSKTEMKRTWQKPDMTRIY